MSISYLCIFVPIPQILDLEAREASAQQEKEDDIKEKLDLEEEVCR